MHMSRPTTEADKRALVATMAQRQHRLGVGGSGSGDNTPRGGAGVGADDAAPVCDRNAYRSVIWKSFLAPMNSLRGLSGTRKHPGTPGAGCSGNGAAARSALVAASPGGAMLRADLVQDDGGDDDVADGCAGLVDTDGAGGGLDAMASGPDVMSDRPWAGDRHSRQRRHSSTGAGLVTTHIADIMLAVGAGGGRGLGLRMVGFAVRVALSGRQQVGVSWDRLSEVGACVVWAPAPIA